MKFSQNKYNVAPADCRTWRQRTYDSQAEMRYAQLCWALIGHEYREVVEQPSVVLVAGFKCRPDFLLVPQIKVPYYVDVKGMQTPAFKRTVQMWRAHGRLDLHVVKAHGDKFQTVEVIEGPRP